MFNVDDTARDDAGRFDLDHEVTRGPRHVQRLVAVSARACADDPVTARQPEHAAPIVREAVELEAPVGVRRRACPPAVAEARRDLGRQLATTPEVTIAVELQHERSDTGPGVRRRRRCNICTARDDSPAERRAVCERHERHAVDRRDVDALNEGAGPSDEDLERRRVREVLELTFGVGEAVEETTVEPPSERSDRRAPAFGAALHRDEVPQHPREPRTHGLRHVGR